MKAKFTFAKTLTGASIRNVCSLATSSNGADIYGSRGIIFSFHFALTEFNTMYPLARPCHKVEIRPCMLDRMLQSGKTLQIKEGLHAITSISNPMCLQLVPVRFACGHSTPVSLGLFSPVLLTFIFTRFVLIWRHSGLLSASSTQVCVWLFPLRLACGFFQPVSLRLVPLRFTCGFFTPVSLRLFLPWFVCGWLHSGLLSVSFTQVCLRLFRPRLACALFHSGFRLSVVSFHFV